MQNSYYNNTFQYNKQNNKSCLPILIMLFLSCSMIEDIVAGVLRAFDGNEALSNYVSWLIYGFGFIYISFFLLLKRKFFEMVLLEFIVLILMLISRFFTPDIEELISTAFSTLFISNILAFFVGKYALGDKETFDSILKLVPLYECLAIIYMVLLFSYPVDNYMNTSYNLLFVSCLCFVKAINDRRILYYVLTFFNVVFILAFGASGPLLTIFVTIVLLSFNNLNKGQKVLAILVSILVLSFLLVFYELILIRLASLFPNSRTLLKLIEKNQLNSPRFLIWKFSFNKIVESPFAFRGAFGDRVLLTLENVTNSQLGFWVSESDMSGLYAHNILLEIYLQYGVLIGTILIILFVKKLLRFIKMIKHEYYGTSAEKIMWVFICVALVPLLVSNSYLLSFEFWLLLGLIFSKKTKKQHDKS